MTTNFIHDLNQLPDMDIVGIYGSAHTWLDGLDISESVPCMAHQLKSLYGDKVHSVDLSEYARDMEPIRVDTM